MKNFLLWGLMAVLLGGCSKAADTPSQVIQKVYDAVGKGDTTTYLSLMSLARRQEYAQTNTLRKDVAYWVTAKPQVNILSEFIDGDVAVVKFHCRWAASRTPDTTVSARLYKEDGQWKCGV